MQRLAWGLLASKPMQRCRGADADLVLPCRQKEEEERPASPAGCRVCRPWRGAACHHACATASFAVPAPLAAPVRPLVRAPASLPYPCCDSLLRAGRMIASEAPSYRCDRGELPESIWCGGGGLGGRPWLHTVKPRKPASDMARLKAAVCWACCWMSMPAHRLCGCRPRAGLCTSSCRSACCARWILSDS